MKIDWAYMRKGWKSCIKSREFLENKQIKISDEVDARKEKIEEDNAWAILKSASKIYIGRQKKFSSWVPNDENRAEIMGQALGRSGSLRAPTLKKGGNVFIGFSDEMYKDNL